MHSHIFTFLHFNSGCKNGKLRLFYCDWPKREYDFANNESTNAEIHHIQKKSSQSSLSLSKDQDLNNMLQAKLKANLIETFSSKSTIYGHFSSIHSLDSFDYRKESLVVTCCSDLIIRVFNVESGHIDVIIIFIIAFNVMIFVVFCGDK